MLSLIITWNLVLIEEYDKDLSPIWLIRLTGESCMGDVGSVVQLGEEGIPDWTGAKSLRHTRQRDSLHRKS